MEVTHEKLVKVLVARRTSFVGAGLISFNRIAALYQSPVGLIDQSVSHSSVLFGTLLNSTLASYQIFGSPGLTGTMTARG
jgi:hypothetical protein